MFLVLDRNECRFCNILIAYKGMLPTTGSITKFSLVGFIAIVQEKGDQTCHWWFYLSARYLSQFENYRISSNEISLNRDQICRSKILIKNAGSEPPLSGG
jgi:hypothetical protein